jgi:AraC-like DNA-binding protein
VHATAWDRHHVLAEFQPRGRSGRRRLPLALPLGAWSEYIAKGCAQACACWPGDPPRATAAFWEVLFRIAEVHAAGPPTAPAALERARTWIEAHLGERITPSQVATAAGLSRAHLLRLFRAHEGTTIAGHIRRRRARRAHHLLVQSDLPVREIARRLGIPDLQAFNKTMRRELGRSPRRLRPPA